MHIHIHVYIHFCISDHNDNKPKSQTQVTDEHLSQEMIPNYEPALHHAHQMP